MVVHIYKHVGIKVFQGSVLNGLTIAVYASYANF